MRRLRPSHVTPTRYGAFKSWVITGEAVSLLDWSRVPGATTRTKVRLIDPRQIDQSITRVEDGNNCTLQGVQFDPQGRLAGYWVRPFVLGSFASAPQAVFIRAR